MLWLLRLVCRMKGHNNYVGLNPDGKAIEVCCRCGKKTPLRDWSRKELDRWAKGP